MTPVPPMPPPPEKSFEVRVPARARLGAIWVRVIYDDPSQLTLWRKFIATVLIAMLRVLGPYTIVIDSNTDQLTASIVEKIASKARRA